MTGRVALTLAERAEGRVATVTIDNQARLNTLNAALMAEFRAAMDRLAGDRGLRAVVLRGAGEKAFVGGADIHEMAALDGASARSFIEALHECCAAPARLPVPVIARLQGFALGGGLELAAACDLRVAAESARLGMPEVRIGIPSVIEAALLPRLIGRGRTARLLLTGETISAAAALEWGLVEEVVPDNGLDDAIDRLLAAILSAGAEAVRAQKRLLQAWDAVPLHDAIAHSIDVFAAAWDTPEPAAMMRSFLAARARRAPG